MRRAFIVHGIWFAAVMAAFGVGYILPKKGDGMFGAGNTALTQGGTTADPNGPLNVRAKQKDVILWSQNRWF